MAMAFVVAGLAWAEHMGWGPYRFPFVQAGIIVSAALGGVGPGVLAIVLGNFAWFMFMPPAGKFYLANSIDWVNLVAFTGVDVLIVWAFATPRHRWSVARIPVASHGVTRPQDGSAASTSERRHFLLQSPGILVGLLVVVVALAGFGCWGMFSTAGAAHFDDESMLIPLACLGLAPAILIFGIGLLPVVSLHGSAPRRAASAGLSDRS